jgi:hypothetical protein
MDNLSSGLQFYSTIRNSLFLIVLYCVCSCVSYCYVDALGRNYILSTNSKTSLKHFNGNTPTNKDCSLNAPEPDCFYVNEYIDNKNIEYRIPHPTIDPKKPPNVGPNTTYYEEKNPRNYVQSFIHPANGALILLGIVIILLIAASINLYFIINYKGYGAVMGGIQATSDIVSIFKSR